ncbi:uncharacterized protein LOC108674829 [Hyalella azteca]|uniref:Uncharacterized protein LOC108674829 n=1 Tax=Hyalella azteca TaxID=294128 RepID=A0A8B7NZL1_HYAAZ|nr:uncharacterized protein LOC108674829 [Hyalella azteca]
MKQGAVLLSFSTLMLSLLSTQAMKDPLEEDEFLDKNGILYEDTSYYIDPNDMLADVTLRRQVIKKKAALDESMEKQKRIAHGINECMNIERELHSCQAQHDLLQQQLQSKETSNAKLVSKLSEGNAVDFELHYRRALSLLLQSLQVQTHGWAASSTMQRQLTFVLSEELVTGLQHCIKNKSSGDLVRHCDQVISSLYDAVELAENEIRSSFLWPSFEISSIHGIEMLTLMLTAVIVSLVGWAAILLLWDVRTKRRWWPFMVLLLVLVFTLCCLWNWSIMVKVGTVLPLELECHDQGRYCAASGTGVS